MAWILWTAIAVALGAGLFGIAAFLRRSGVASKNWPNLGNPYSRFERSPAND